VWHGRMWDLHVFVAPDGKHLSVDIVDPFEDIAGDPGPDGAFFAP
jgi:hypothetical protein